jgi:hypothetical protein
MVFRKTGASRRNELGTAAAPAAPLAAPPATGQFQYQEQRLAMRERQIEAYEAAMRLIIDRQFPLYDEELEISIKIGSSALEDVVTEKHRTDPRPYLTYRVVRPITAFSTPGEDAIESLAITCEVDRADVGVAVQAVPDPSNRPRALIMFQPGLERPAEWTLRYRAPGLWNPLREDGVDRLTWAAGTLDKRHVDGIRELRVHFEFPTDAADVEVSEVRGAGKIEASTPTNVIYTDRSQTGGEYAWELLMRPG